MSIRLSIARLIFLKNTRKRIAFYEDFSEAISEGHSARDRIIKLRERSLRRGGILFVPLYDLWLARLDRSSHKGFSTCLAGCVPNYEMIVLAAAEKDSRLDEGMEFLAKNLDVRTKISSAYLIGLMSPILSILVILSMLAMFYHWLAPRFIEIMPYKTWPQSTKSLYELSEMLVSNFFLTLGLFALSVFVLQWTKGNWTGRIRRYVDHIPLLPWKSHRVKEADAFLMSLSLMMRSDSMGFLQALEELHKLASPWLRQYIDLMLKKLTVHSSQAALALDTGLFEEVDMYRIEDFCERSSFQVAMKKLSEKNSEHLLAKAKVRVAIIGLFALIGIAGFIMFYALSVAQLGYSLQVSM